jgi:hypothetical protein
MEVYASNIISPYHVAGLKSFIAYISSGEAIKGEVMLSKAHWDGPLVHEENLGFLGGNVSVALREPKFSLGSLLAAFILLLLHRSTNASCYIVSHSRVNIKLIAYLFEQGKISWNTNFSVVVFDEGIGNYGGFLYLFKAYLRQFKGSRWHSLLYLAIYPVNQIILRASFIIDYNWRLVSINRDVVQENCQAKVEYCKYFYSLSKGDVERCSNDVLLITQPIVAFGLIDQESYLQGLRKLVYEVNSKGSRLLIKTHPSEDDSYYENLGLEIIASSGPVESLILELKPKLIVGLTSTSLINSKLILDIPSYCITSLFENSSKVTGLISQDSNINMLFNHYVESVLSWDQLIELLET